MAQHVNGQAEQSEQDGSDASGAAVKHASAISRYVNSLKAHKPVPIIATIVAAIIVIGLLAWAAFNAVIYVEDLRAAKEMSQIAEPSTKLKRSKVNEGDPEEAKDPNAGLDYNIDWGKYRDVNPDIYAWLYVPGTGINMPVAQYSGQDDAYYLNHNYWGERSALGAAFSELQNSQDFSDPVTVFYGHDASSVFKNLHDFEDESFFNKHDRFYVYTPNNKMYTYRIVAAYRTDNSHILNTNNTKSESGRQRYYKKVMNPTDSVSHVRDGATLNAGDKILQLSTCMLNELPPYLVHRYVVTGVLEGEQDAQQSK